MRRLLRDPLLHFAFLGVGLFALAHVVGDDSAAETGGEIVVTEGRVAALTEKFSKVWQRPPTEEELDGLIDDYIHEEVFYRQALAMGLDRDDTIVRRRMRQKLRFISEDVASLEEPTEKKLEDLLKARLDYFRRPSRFSFRQVYINENERGAAAEADAKTRLVELRAGGDASTVGDRLMTAHRFENETTREVERALGKQFLEELANVPVGSWQGPVRSGFGLHLVHISKRTEGEVPPLAEIRDVVIREWTADKRTQTNEELYQRLRRRYKVTIIKPAASSASAAPATAP